MSSRASQPEGVPPASPEKSSAALQEALRQVSALVDAVVDVLGEPGGVVALGNELRSTASKALDALADELAGAAALVSARSDHAAWDASFSEAGWADRERVILSALDDDLDRGTAEWFDSWLRAMAAGAREEAWRILGMTCPLADWAVWLPDRTAVVQRAVEIAVDNPPAAAALIVNLVEVLSTYDSAAGDHVVFGALDRLATDSAQGRILLLIVVARVLALVGDQRAGILLDQARQLLRSVHPGSEASLGRAIVTAESLLARHGISTGVPRRRDSLRSGAMADLFAIHEFIQLRLLDERRDPADASSWESGTRGPSLAEVQGLVDGLKSTAGAQERLTMLLERPADELTLALAIRMTRERQFSRAEQLVFGIWTADLSTELRLPAAQLAVTIAEASDLPPVEVAEVFAAAGDLALSANEADYARQCFERALGRVPDDPGIMRSLADALQFGTTGKDSESIRRDLVGAIELCERAAERDPVTREKAWVHSLVRTIYQQLDRYGEGQRGDYPWRALAETLAALQLGDDSDERRTQLIQDLVDVGLEHSAARQADALRRRTGDTIDTVMTTAYATLRTDAVPDVLALLEDLPPGFRADDPGWVAALRGYAHGRLDDDSAGSCFAEALAGSSQLPYLQVYRAWAASYHTRRGESEADELWAALWKDADLGDSAQASRAATAALYQGSYISARRLSERLLPSQTLTLGIPPVAMTLAMIDVIDAPRESVREAGWARAAWAMSRTIVLEDLEMVARLARAILRRSAIDHVDTALRRLDEIASRERRRISATVPADRSEAMVAELVWAESIIDDEFVRRTIEGVRAFVLRESDDAAEGMMSSDPVVSDASHEAASGVDSDRDVDDGADGAIVVGVPPSWFVGWQDREMDHEFFVRGYPLAYAAILRRLGPEGEVPPISVRIDSSCTPDRLKITVPGGEEVVHGFFDSAAWYCPEEWLPGLTPERRATAEYSDSRKLYVVADPEHATDRLSSWSEAEAVARTVFRVTGLGAAEEDDRWNAQQSSSE